MPVRSVLYFSFRQLARWRKPRLAACLLYAISRSLVTKGRNSKNARYRAVVMARAGFFEDIEETFREDGAFKVIYWPSYVLKAFASAILSPSLDHNYYITNDPEIEATKKAYRGFLAATWDRFFSLFPADVVLTGNFSYCAEREFATALEEAGIPFIAIHKENVRPPKRVEYWHYLYKERRGPFTGRKVLVYNDIERQLEIASGVAPSDKIVITGMPRLDRVHRWRRANAGVIHGKTQSQVLFFAFARHEKLTAIQRKPSAGVAGDMEAMDGDWGKMSWKELGEGAHHAMVELARRRPDINVIIKTKGQRRKKDDILLMLRSAGNDLPANLKIVAGGDPFDLMIDSQVVVGFNTTGLLEAIAAGKPVVVPWFGEAQDVVMRDHIIDFEDAVTYAASPAALIEHITRFIDHRVDIPGELPAAGERALHKWVGNQDGAAAERVLEAILAEIPDRLSSSAEFSINAKCTNVRTAKQA